MQRIGGVVIWAGVGLAKGWALLLLIADADGRWPEAGAALLLAWGLVAMALWWRARPGGERHRQ